MNHLSRFAGLTAILVTVSGAYGEPYRQEDGRKAYESSCATCHDTGTNGAPSIHKPGDWADRSDLWETVLFEHANKGFLNMPAKGGNQQASEYDVDAAAEYMLNMTHPDYPQD